MALDWPGVRVGALNLDVFFVAKRWIPLSFLALLPFPRAAAAAPPHERSEVRNEIRGKSFISGPWTRISCGALPSVSGVMPASTATELTASAASCPGLVARSVPWTWIKPRHRIVCSSFREKFCVAAYSHSQNITVAAECVRAYMAGGARPKAPCPHLVVFSSFCLDAQCCQSFTDRRHHRLRFQGVHVRILAKVSTLYR